MDWCRAAWSLWAFARSASALCGSASGRVSNWALRSEEIIRVIRRKRRSSSQEKSEEELSSLRKSRESLPPMRSRDVEEMGMGVPRETG
jgi:hypothetical protein